MLVVLTRPHTLSRLIPKTAKISNRAIMTQELSVIIDDSVRCNPAAEASRAKGRASDARGGARKSYYFVARETNTHP